jgi:hypothetical protein
MYISGFDALMVRDVTKSSAMQRAGRAGREVFRFIEQHVAYLPRRCRVLGFAFVYSLRKPSLLFLRLRSLKFAGPVLLRACSS